LTVSSFLLSPGSTPGGMFTSLLFSPSLHDNYPRTLPAAFDA
jgi:hypothetical protein